MKKTLALALVVMMLCVCAFSVSAAETTLPNLTTQGFWSAHSDGVAVTEDGVEITLDFQSTGENGVFSNWHAPSVVVYYGTEAKVNGADYAEIAVIRSDAYGWTPTAPFWGPNGYGEDAAAWAAWLEGCKNGAVAAVSAQLADGNAVVTLTANGMSNTYTFPLEEGKDVYISLSGEFCAMSNIKVTTPDPAPAVCEHTTTEVKDAKDATCTEAGYTGDTYCLDCGEKVGDGSEIAVLDHVYADGACTACGAVDPDYQQPTEPEQGGDSAGTGDMFGIVLAVMAASGIALVTLKKKEN